MGNAGRKHVELGLAGIDHLDAHRQERQDLCQHPPDMAGAENIDLRRRRLFLGNAHDEVTAQGRIGIAQADFDAPAAALADFRAERHIHRLLGSPFDQQAPRMVDDHIFERPTANGAENRPHAHQHERAPLPRRRSPHFGQFANDGVGIGGEESGEVFTHRNTPTRPPPQEGGGEDRSATREIRIRVERPLPLSGGGWVGVLQ